MDLLCFCCAAAISGFFITADKTILKNAKENTIGKHERPTWEGPVIRLGSQRCAVPEQGSLLFRNQIFWISMTLNFALSISINYNVVAFFFFFEHELWVIMCWLLMGLYLNNCPSIHPKWMIWVLKWYFVFFYFTFIFVLL